MTETISLLTLILTGIVLLLVAVIFISRKTGAEGGDKLAKTIHEELQLGREESARAARELRQEVSEAQRSSSASVVTTIDALGRTQKEALAGATSRIGEMTTSNEQRMDAMRKEVDARLAQLQEGNERKLEQMRAVVDEKLQSTLERRLGDSFKLVSERLEAVQRGLGEMRDLANGVGDLQRVLTNVKARGTWGEVQLGSLLEQILTPDQYATNVRTKENTSESVEYAVSLPGPDGDSRSCVWLPIDAKFPQEDYLKLVEASEAADPDAVSSACSALIRSIRSSAKDINEKYLNPPATTDFAVMFLPTEGLYAEVLRQPGLIEEVQRTHRVVIAGPTTLAALLNSLRMGFRTLAIEQRSSEVWQVLAAVKTEFGKFGTVLAKVKKQLHTASNSIDQTERRTRVMERKLRDVESLPSDSAQELLDFPEDEEAAEDKGSPEV